MHIRSLKQHICQEIVPCRALSLELIGVIIIGRFMYFRFRPVFFVFVLTSFAISSASLRAQEDSDATSLETHLSGDFSQGVSPTYDAEIRTFYKARSFEPVWFSQNGEALKDVSEIEQAVHEHAYLNGLDAQEYNFQSINKQEAENEQKQHKREWMLTNAVMHYLQDIQAGRIEPSRYDEKIFRPAPKPELAKSAAELLEARDYLSYLATVEPQQDEYQALKDKLVDFRGVEQEGGWPEIDLKPGTVVEPGESHEVIPQVRARLENGFHMFDGDLPKGVWLDQGEEAMQALNEKLDKMKDDQDSQKEAKENAELVLDADLARKIAEFQYTHGQKIDGVIGPNTIKAMNVPAEQRIDQMTLAMERWRWLPDDLGDKHVRLNIAGFYVRAVENGKDEFVMPIIVGQVAHQTPVFSSRITNIKFNPDWTAPDSIAERYLIEKIQNDPSVIDKLGYQVQKKSNGEIIPWSKINIENLDKIDLDSYQFRQKPGEENALGLARFSIENDYAIFMHGTPKTHLFDEGNRTFSSGCIRVEDPLQMSKFLLEEEGISHSKIEDLYYVKPGEDADTDIVDIKRDIPVYLTYMTAWVDQQNGIHFTDDIYGRDQKLERSLAELN